LLGANALAYFGEASMTTKENKIFCFVGNQLVKEFLFLEINEFLKVKNESDGGIYYKIFTAVMGSNQLKTNH